MRKMLSIVAIGALLAIGCQKAQQPSSTAKPHEVKKPVTQEQQAPTQHEFAKKMLDKSTEPAKPAETKPAEAKPAATKPAETQPAKTAGPASADQKPKAPATTSDKK